MNKLTKDSILKISDEELLNSDIQNDLKPEDKKLTNWRNEPSIQSLKTDYTKAQSSQSGYIAKIDTWHKLYDAPKWGSDKHRGSRINPKLVRKQAEWGIPSLTEPFLSTNNLFDVKPLTYEDIDRAKQNALVLNRQFNTQLNKIKLVDGVIRQVVKSGTCIVRTGWDFYEKEVLEDVEEFEYTVVNEPNTMGIGLNQEQLSEQLTQQDPMAMMTQQPPSEYEQLSSQYDELAQLRQTQPDSYEQLPSELKAGFEMSEEKGELIKATSLGFVSKKVLKTIYNKPTAKICDIKNIYIDPTCRDDFDNAQFIIHTFESSLSDLKKAGIYDNLDSLKDYVENNDLQHNGISDFKFSDTARKKLVVHEYWGYWDIHGNGETYPIVACWVGDTLIRLDENPYPDGKLPFVVFNYIPQENSVYGIPNAELLGDNQEILGAVTRGVIDLLGKSANSQTGYAKTFVDETNKHKFLKGMDYEFNPNMHPSNAVFTHKYPEIPNSAMTIIQMMNNEAESLSGVKAFSGTGISASSLGDVASGVRGVLDAVSKREMSILRRLSDGFIALGRKIIAMNSEFLSEEEVVRVTNSEFVKVRREDLAGDFDLVLTISTAEGDDAKAKELSFMLQTIGNTMGADITQMMLSEIAHLRKMPDLAKAISEYKPQPDENAQKMQELQMARIQAEIELIQSQANENNAKAQVQTEKVNVEKARAESLQGDADNKALEFVEKESGTKHQREIDKQNSINTGLHQKEYVKGDIQRQLNKDKHNQTILSQMAQKELADNVSGLVNATPQVTPVSPMLTENG